MAKQQSKSTPKPKSTTPKPPASKPNWPSKKPGKKSGPDRDNNPSKE